MAMLGEPHVVKLAEVEDHKLHITRLIALWDDGAISDCSRPEGEIHDIPPEISCDTEDFFSDPARVFYGRVQIEAGLGHKVKVLHDPEATKFIPDIENFEEIK